MQKVLHREDLIKGLKQDEICEILWEHEITPTLLNRIAVMDTAIPVDLESL